MAKKKEEKLKPMEEKVEGSMKTSEYKHLLDSVTHKSNIIDDDDEVSSDTFFRAIITEMVNNRDIETKTEYINKQENFYGIRLSFMSRYCDNPIIDNFVNIFETKRVSLERKGRKELLMALQERKQELEREQAMKLKSMFGM